MAYRIFALIILSALNGCATYSPVATQAEKTEFFESSKDPKLATLFLTCGKHMVNGGEPTFASSNNNNCQYIINGIKYSKIEWGQVGKLYTKGGTIAVDNMYGQDPIKNITVPSGSSALLVSDFNEQYNKTAMLFGAAGAIYDLATTDRSKLNGPLQVYTGDFKSKIPGLIPVVLQVVKQ